MLKVGLTGGIACGKSTVAAMLVQRGGLLLDADQLAREAVAPGEPAWQEIKAWLGEAYFLENGSLDRKKVAALVFGTPAAREKLNAIVHPHVLVLMRQFSRKLEIEKGTGVQIWDVPLLFETRTEGEVDLILVVAASEQIRINRLRQRNGFTAAEARLRILSQMSLEDKIRAAHYIIYNNGDIDDLLPQVDLFWQKITAKEI